MDYKALLNQVQRTLATIDTSIEPRDAISKLAETIATNFKELGITGGRLYECRENMYELVDRFGPCDEGELGILVPREYRPMMMVVENGVLVMDPTDPAVDPVLEEKLGARRFAAIAVGDEDWVLAFDVAPESSKEDILFSLNIVRYSINQALRTQTYESLLKEAQRIQQSILPQRVPNYEGFDIFGKTVAAETISGDFYDFIPVSDSILGLAIADGTGHGLPAALVVRDVYMGLRMGVDRDFKIVRTMQKLNHIIHRSRLTTKFVTLFYGELELGGTFIYTNAGHNPPFILRQKTHELLTQGGPVLGPTPDATYKRGYVRVEKGDVLCLYSDGIVEAHDGHDREFGLDRLIQIVKKHREEPSQAIAQEVLQKVAKWGREGEDDRTIVVVRATQ